MKANVKKQTMQKVVVQTISAKLQSVKLIVNGRYKTIREVATAIGVNMPQRTGFVFLDRNKTIALCCAQIGGKTKWLNTLSADEKTFIEKDTHDKTPSIFQKRVCGSPNYSVNMRRLLFVKENGYYRYVGIFRVATFDFDAQQVVMKRDPVNITLKVKVTTRKTVTVITEESSMEVEVNI